MENYIKRGSLNIHNALDRFLTDEVLSGLDIASDEFWEKFEGLLEEFHQRNKDLLAKRSFLQNQISTWHKNNDFIFFGNIMSKTKFFSIIVFIAKFYKRMTRIVNIQSPFGKP